MVPASGNLPRKNPVLLLHNLVHDDKWSLCLTQGRGRSLVHRLNKATAEIIHVLAMHECCTQHHFAFEGQIARGASSEMLVLDPYACVNV